jgi:hypothetical protein
MMKVAPLNNRLGAPGPQLFWLIPLAMLTIIGLATLFAFLPGTTAFALIGAATLLLLKFKKAFVWLFPAYIVFGAGSIAMAHEVYNPTLRCGWTGQFCQTVRGSAPNEFVPWVNITDIGEVYGGGVARITKTPDAPTGDVMILSPRFERKTRQKDDLRCDARCFALLRHPAVESVTIHVEPDIWNQGPRALMAFLRPDARTFEVQHSAECRNAVEGKLAPLSADGSGTSLQKAARLGQECMMSYPAKDGVEYSAVYDDSAFSD